MPADLLIDSFSSEYHNEPWKALENIILSPKSLVTHRIQRQKPAEELSSNLKK